MTQDEKWMKNCEEVVAFIKKNHRNPSKHRIEEHNILNWVKANRKKMNAGELKEPRLSMLMKLLALSERYKRKNQYE